MISALIIIYGWGFYFYVKAYSHSVMSVFGIASKLTIFVSNGETRSWSSQLRKYIFMRRFNTVRKVRTTAICLHLLVLTRQDPTSTLLSDKIYSKILWEERHWVDYIWQCKTNRRKKWIYLFVFAEQSSLSRQLQSITTKYLSRLESHLLDPWVAERPWTNIRLI